MHFRAVSLVGSRVRPGRVFGLRYTRRVMDRDRLRRIAHRDHPLHDPIGEARLERILSRVELPAPGFVVDIGCGEGEVLLRLLARFEEARGEGIDVSVPAVANAQNRAAEHLRTGRCRFHRGDARQFTPARPATLVVCMGVAHFFGGLRETIRHVTPWLAPGGELLLAAYFWERTPDEAALEPLQAKVEDYRDLVGTIAEIEAEGFVPRYMSVSDASDWDEYESLWCAAIERHVRATPGDPDAAELLRIARAHRAGYLRGYRGVLGYVSLVLARA